MDKKKSHQFKVGDRVGEATSENMNGECIELRYDPEIDPTYGVITDVLSDGKVLVKWDDQYYNREGCGYSRPQDPAGLMLETDVQAKLSRLEKEFLAVEKQVSSKLKEAAKLLREANKLAKKTGHSLEEMDTSALYSAMDSCGWNTSSFGC